MLNAIGMPMKYLSMSCILWPYVRRVKILPIYCRIFPFFLVYMFYCVSGRGDGYLLHRDNAAICCQIANKSLQNFPQFAQIHIGPGNWSPACWLSDEMWADSAFQIRSLFHQHAGFLPHCQLCTLLLSKVKENERRRRYNVIQSGFFH
jgi:hypothetical protein